MRTRETWVAVTLLVFLTLFTWHVHGHLQTRNSPCPACQVWVGLEALAFTLVIVTLELRTRRDPGTRIRPFDIPRFTTARGPPTEAVLAFRDLETPPPEVRHAVIRDRLFTVWRFSA